jgi:hypothetical protein
VRKSQGGWNQYRRFINPERYKLHSEKSCDRTGSRDACSYSPTSIHVCGGLPTSISSFVRLASRSSDALYTSILGMGAERSCVSAYIQSLRTANCLCRISILIGSPCRVFHTATRPVYRYCQAISMVRELVRCRDDFSRYDDEFRGCQVRDVPRRSPPVGLPAR